MLRELRNVNSNVLFIQQNVVASEMLSKFIYTGGKLFFTKYRERQVLFH